MLLPDDFDAVTRRRLLVIEGLRCHTPRLRHCRLFHTPLLIRLSLRDAACRAALLRLRCANHCLLYCYAITPCCHAMPSHIAMPLPITPFFRERHFHYRRRRRHIHGLLARYRCRHADFAIVISIDATPLMIAHCCRFAAAAMLTCCFCCYATPPPSYAYAAAAAVTRHVFTSCHCAMISLF